MNVTPELVISVFALAGSLYAIWQTKKQHRLSMMPHLELPFDRKRMPDGVIFTLTLKNTGLGPAIIMDRWYSIEKRRYESELGDPMEQIAARVLAGHTKYHVRRHGLPGIGSILPAGDQICIYEVFVANVTADKEDDVIKLADGVDFEGRYRSICGDTFFFGTNDKRAKASGSPKPSS